MKKDYYYSSYRSQQHDHKYAEMGEQINGGRKPARQRVPNRGSNPELSRPPASQRHPEASYLRSSAQRGPEQQLQAEPAKRSSQQRQPEPEKRSAQQRQPEPEKRSAQQRQSEPAKRSAQQRQSEPAKRSAQQRQPEPDKRSAQQKQAEPAKRSSQQKQAEPAKRSAQRSVSQRAPETRRPDPAMRTAPQRRSGGNARPVTANGRPKKRKKKHSRKFFILLPIVLILLAVIVFLTIKISGIKAQADNVKYDLEQLLDHVKAKDVQSAEADLAQSYTDCDALEAALTDPFWSAAAKIPFVARELDTGKELISVVRTAQDKLLTPLLAKMKETPLTGLKVGDNAFNVRLINSYLDLLETLHPDLISLTEQINNIDTDSFTGGFMRKYKEKLQTYMGAYATVSDYLPLLRSVLGKGEDKLYLLVAQNSAEIRASGGFPGSIGTIKITNGILTIGDFTSVYNVLSNTISPASEVTVTEQNLFGDWVNAPRDSCFIPAFERAAKIWAVGYEDWQRQHGAQDHERGVAPSDGTSQDYPDDYSDDSWDYDSYSYATYDAGTYGNRLTYYVSEFGYGGGYTGYDDGYTRTASHPDQQSEEDYNTGAYIGDGGVFYSFYNDFYGYTGGGSEYVQYVDGVISLTPAIIQILLTDVGEITLSDGTTLDGFNATKVLQHDLYHKYFDEANITENSNWTADKLFAETAKKVMKQFIASFDIGKFADYYEMFKQGAEDRIIMAWMADEAQEAVLDEIGLSGRLNYQPDEPEAGVFFSLADPSKMGWYLDIDTYIDEVPVINYDGTRTYDVSVTLTNVIEDSDIQASNTYILGSYNGAIRGFVHCFGPYGGTISDFVTSGSSYILESQYHDLDVGYNLDVLIEPGQSVHFDYKITTAPFVEAVPTIVTTPTLTNYR